LFAVEFFCFWRPDPASCFMIHVPATKYLPQAQVHIVHKRRGKVKGLRKGIGGAGGKGKPLTEKETITFYRDTQFDTRNALRIARASRAGARSVPSRKPKLSGCNQRNQRALCRILSQRCRSLSQMPQLCRNFPLVSQLAPGEREKIGAPTPKPQNKRPKTLR
jgi:hypothetical protein